MAFDSFFSRLYHNCSLPVSPVSSRPQDSSVQTMTRVVKHGDNVTLSCSVKHKNQTVWYGQQSNKLPFIIISAQRHQSRQKDVLNKFYRGSTSGFTTKFEDNSSISLTICNMTGSLLLYLRSWGGGTVFGSGHVLTYKNASVASKSDEGMFSSASHYGFMFASLNYRQRHEYCEFCVAFTQRNWMSLQCVFLSLLGNAGC